MWVMTHSWVWMKYLVTCGTCLIDTPETWLKYLHESESSRSISSHFFFCEVSSYMWFVTNSYVWMKCPVIYWRWLIDTCELWLEYLHESKYLHEPKFSRSSLLSVGDTTHLYVRHDSFLCETWLMHMCDMAHLNTKYDLNACTILLGCHASNIMYLCIYKWDIMHL